MAEVRAGFRQGSVASSHEPGALDRTESWNDLQRELEDIGVSASMVDEHQTFIKAWFKDVIVSGVLHEDGGGGGGAGVASDGRDRGYEPRLAGSEDSHDDDDIKLRSLSFVTASDAPSGASSSGLRSQPTLVGSEQASERGDYAVQPRRPMRHRTTVQDLDALASTVEPPFPRLPTALLRKPSMASLLYHRLFQNDMRLVEATSDGSLERVATLISRGANVNVRDKWGWSALSMAAYGGHEHIAKLLLACGADIEFVDVDGDSPMDLATNRGHAAVVIAIEEERANRVARGLPDPGVPGVKVRTGSKVAKSSAGTKANSKDASPGANVISSSASEPASASVSTWQASSRTSLRHDDDVDDDDDDDDNMPRLRLRPSAPSSTGTGTGTVTGISTTPIHRPDVGPTITPARSDTDATQKARDASVAVTVALDAEPRRL